jgi:hypothetical protein
MSKVYRYHPQDRREADRWEFANSLNEVEFASLCALLAKVRCREVQRSTRLEEAIAHAGYDVDALLKSYDDARKKGTANWR